MIMIITAQCLKPVDGAPDIVAVAVALQVAVSMHHARVHDHDMIVMIIIQARVHDHDMIVMIVVQALPTTKRCA